MPAISPAGRSAARSGLAGIAGVAGVARFHAGVGARLALRAAAPAFAAAFGAATLLGPDFLNSFSGALYGPEAGPGTWLVPALAAFALASAAAWRVCRGLPAGWLRHLPVAGSTHRRGAVLAVAVTQAPLLIALAVLASAAARLRWGPTLPALAGLPLLALAAATLAVPARRRPASAPLAAAASLAAASGRAGWVALSAALLVAADLAAGPMAAPRRGGARRSPLRRSIRPPLQPIVERSPAGPRSGAAPGRAAGEHRRPERAGGGHLTVLGFSWRIAWRALGGRLAGSYVLGLLPLAAGALFLANNELAPRDAALAARLAAGVSVVLLLASLGEALAALRPAWPWARSLPWSAERRVAADAVWMALHAAPLLAVAAVRAPLPALAAALALPLVALRAAGAVRRAPERRTGVSGEILLEGMAAAAAVALLPWAGLLLLAGTPLALTAAAGRERRQRVSRWLELHHLAAGDPQSWSAE